MIGDTLRKLRKEANMTQSDLAKKIGVQRSLISKYESGAIDPTFSQLQRIVDAMGISYIYLYDFSEGRSYVTLNSQDRIRAAFDMLNEEGQKKAVERIEELTEVPKYRKENDPRQPNKPVEE